MKCIKTKKQADIMNNAFFHSGVTIKKESVFKELVLKDITAKVHKADSFGKLNVRKAPVSDGVSYWILRECREHLADKIGIMIQNS